MLHTLGILTPPYLSTQPKNFSVITAAKEMKGKNSSLLIEATEYKYRISLESLFAGVYLICQREGSQRRSLKESWRSW